MKLKDLKSPAQIKDLSYSELQDLASQIRTFLIDSISKTGGHLSSNLGSVELTLAMHKVFDSPKDKFIFDVGHQAYTHKILTGRMDQFDTLRRKDGLSGYQKMAESPHDPWEAGHSSTSLSAALGMAAARDIQHEDYNVVAVIGDGALSGGMAMEALNDCGAQQRKMIIIFNDNKMSISKNKGGMEQAITRARTSDLYRNTKKGIHARLDKGQIGKGVMTVLHNSRDILKSHILSAPIFSQFNLDYLGPVDGHNLQELVDALETAKEHNGPVVVHVVTQKGKGYPYAEQDTVGKWHGVSPFHIDTGKPKASPDSSAISWSEVISNTLIDLASKDPAITAITPAMANGSKLLMFARKFPDRFFDCGIAEQHALTMAAGMAAGGLKPFVSIYSSFLQRAYDQASHDIARMNLPVVVGVDRAGLVGDDGETHQGIYDIAFLRTIPNVVISQPKDAFEAQDLLRTGFDSGRPFFIRYPRGNVHYEKKETYEPIPIGSWTYTDVGTPEQIVITYGPDVDHVIERAKANQMGLRVVNARFFKPVDTKMIRELAATGLPITVYETDTTAGGLSDAILEELNQIDPKVEILGIPDAFVPHGSIPALRHEVGISTDDLFKRLEAHEQA